MRSRFSAIRVLRGRLARRLMLLSLLLLSATLTPQFSFGAQQGPYLEIRWPRHVEVGQPIELEFIARHSPGIAGFETQLLFDTSVGYLGGLRQRENDVRRFGRDVGPLQVAELTDGAALGFYSCATDDCVQPRGNGRRPGARGTVRLATVLIGATEPGALEIKLSATRFVDPAGNAVQFDLPTPSVTVEVGDGGSSRPAPDGGWQLAAPQAAPSILPDLTGDGLINHADVMEVAMAWTLAREASQPCSDLLLPDRDVNGDGCIDVADVQAMAAASLGGATPQTMSGGGPALLSLASFSPASSSRLVASVLQSEMTFTVNTNVDGADDNPGDGICRSQAGCTLRAAIQEANAHSGPDRIVFNIPGSGVQTILLKTRIEPLNDLSGPTTIDGYTQPGASVNSDNRASNARIMIELRGNGSADFDALYITSGGNVVRGLAFYNLKRSIWLYGNAADNNVIAGNFIGTNAAGTFSNTTYAYPASGIVVENGASSNRIGGTANADRNVISGNARHGIEIHAQGSNSNVVYNNLIGLTPAGTGRLQNLKHGIDLNRGSSSNIIGGTGAGQRNIISGNGNPNLNDYTAGVEISHDRTTVQNQVIGNCLGTDVTCTTAPDWAYNSHYGIRLEDGVTNNVVAQNVIGNSRQGGIQLDNYYTSGNRIYDNRIGVSLDGRAIPNQVFGVRIKYNASGNVVGPNNIIANNPVGVRVEYINDDFNTITRNSIYDNAELGIDLGPFFGVNGNDAGDTDSGANQELNHPVLSRATTSQVTGRACAESIVVRPCTVEVFIAASNPGDRSGGNHGQGRTFVGSGTVNSDGSFTVSISGVQSGALLTTTVTDGEGNTSEYSRNIVVESGGTSPTPTPAPTATPASTPPPGSGCGALLQEAEAGVLSGNFTVAGDGAASGGQYVHVPNGAGSQWGVSGNSHYASYCFTVTTAGTYRVRGWVHAANGEDDSFFVTIDGAPSGGYVWDVLLNTSYQADYVSNRGGADPVELTLSVGDHVVRVYLREDGTRLDRVELVRVP